MSNEVFKALADPHRRRILQLLKKRSMSVTDIQKHFAFTGATLSHHLDVLKRADLVTTERRGQFIHYALNTSVIEEVLSAFYSLFSC
ncbi:MAG: autorepressor SdpR family transcription factor [Candidatus Peribacteraceae bacterium]|nr:autorepressor SdpR family transcription factor [Candidatus Peribacteraceae bacterium]